MSNEPDSNTVLFTRYDAGWVILCIGMAIGGAMVFMPVQVGMTGLWVFLAASAIAYPGVYLFQKFYLETLTKTESAEDYTDIITQYLGKNWAMLLSILYFLLMLTGMLGYSTGLVRDSASYLQTYGVTKTLLSDTAWWPFVIMLVMVAIAAQGERLLFKVSGPLVVGKLAIILVLGMVMIPHWSLANIKPLTSLLPFVRDVFITIPFTVFSVVFMPILSPMNIAYRRVETDRRIATYRAFRASRVAFAILIVSVLFFALSFTLSLHHEKAVEAYQNNISALAIAAQVLPGAVIRVMSTALNIFALVTAFFALYLALQEGLQGICFNLLSRFLPEERINRRALHLFVALAIAVGLWGWVQMNAKVLFILHLSAPLFGIIACFIPVYLIFKMPYLAYLKGFRALYVLLFGIILTISPLLRFLE
ncbi:MAG: transporter [Desulfovibrio sp. MES5]|uniref:amino acid permease n=1 Tax=Desulfovibrio sp. MES5 TaxID=1899016 RepID=UPI000B9D253A|nr:amino acid permease [Desulfovibrio sp. MES5]OXS28631.1 MAG: transporter [Desulfovibrio sp. MES5]